MPFFAKAATLLCLLVSGTTASGALKGKEILGEDLQPDDCGALETCYIEDVETGEIFDFSKQFVGDTMLENTLDSHTIICNTTGSIDKVTFEYGVGQVHEEFVAPWTMGGDNVEEGMKDVPYLVTPEDHIKTIKVKGELSTRTCFVVEIQLSVTEVQDAAPGDRRELILPYLVAAAFLLYAPSAN